MQKHSARDGQSTLPMTAPTSPINQSPPCRPIKNAPRPRHGASASLQPCIGSRTPNVSYFGSTYKQTTRGGSKKSSARARIIVSDDNLAAGVGLVVPHILHKSLCRQHLGGRPHWPQGPKLPAAIAAEQHRGDVPHHIPFSSGPQLLIQAHQVCPQRRQRDAEPIGDLFIGPAAADGDDHFTLAGSEVAKVFAQEHLFVLKDGKRRLGSLRTSAICLCHRHLRRNRLGFHDGNRRRSDL